jgi:hypothetical protein
MPRRKLQPALPKLSPDLKLQPHDFLSVIALVPEGCPMIGGQAVAYWANRYATTPATDPITSKDIDFWGSRDDVKTLAKRLQRPAIYPNAYEMTVWAGAIEISIKGRTTLVEMLHTVPGLDANQPEQAALTREIQGTELYILSPVSLVLAKLHALRHFDQEQREDKRHLLISIVCSAHYISELLSGKHIRLALQECERVIRVHLLKSTRRLQSEHGFNLLDAIPVAAMKAEMDHSQQNTNDHRRLRNFFEKRWPEVSK